MRPRIRADLHLSSQRENARHGVLAVHFPTVIANIVSPLLHFSLTYTTLIVAFVIFVHFAFFLSELMVLIWFPSRSAFPDEFPPVWG